VIVIATTDAEFTVTIIQCAVYACFLINLFIASI